MTTLDGVNGTVCNAQQYRQSLSSHDNPNPSISCLTYGQTIGLTLAAGASFLSLVSVISIYIWIGWNVRWHRKNVPRKDWNLFQRPFDIYMSALLGFNIVQAMGGILDVRWAHNGIVTTGPYCTAQSVIQQLGDLGVGLITLILTVHTFVAALWRVGLKARGFALGLIGLVCIFCTLWVGIGAGIHKNYAAPIPFWCWIGPQYRGERLGGEYVFLWLALFASVLFYIPLYFWTEGRLSVNENNWHKFHTHNFNERAAPEYAQRRAARRMLLYPLTYSLVVLPLSIARWSLFDHQNVSSAATFFTVSIFNLSGVINVLLLLIVRPQLLLLTRPECKVSVCVGLEMKRMSRTRKTLEGPTFLSKAPPAHRLLRQTVLDISPPTHSAYLPLTRPVLDIATPTYLPLTHSVFRPAPRPLPPLPLCSQSQSL